MMGQMTFMDMQKEVNKKAKPINQKYSFHRQWSV